MTEFGAGGMLVDFMNDKSLNAFLNPIFCYGAILLGPNLFALFLFLFFLCSTGTKIAYGKDKGNSDNRCQMLTA